MAVWGMREATPNRYVSQNPPSEDGDASKCMHGRSLVVIAPDGVTG